MKHGATALSALSDNELMTSVREGEVAQLGVLFERYHVRLYNFFVKHTGFRGKGSLSEDLTQETFLRMLKYRHTYRADVPFTVWMYQIARNIAIDSFKQRKHEYALQSMDETIEERVTDGTTVAHELERAEEERLLRHALARLEPERREVLILSRFEGLKYEEIAAIQGVQVGTVKSRVHHALNDLREHFHNVIKEQRP